MQKIILTLALVAGFTGAANAQRRSIRERSQGSSGTLSLGVKAGGTASDIVGADASSVYEGIYGYHAGVFANITLTKMFAFQPEILYSQKGGKRLYTAEDYVTRRFHYVDIPLAFHFNADGFFLEAGPQVGLLVAAQDKYGSASSSINTNQFKTADVGYIAGLGFQRKAGLGIGFRYNGEFTNVPQATTIANVTLQPHERNSTFQLYLSYSFNNLYK